MKKIVMTASVLLFVVAVFSVVGDHYRQDLYAAAMEFESSKAQLSYRTGRFDETSFAYLEGPKSEGQETIFLLHGFSANKYNWLRFAGHLSSDYHIIALDLMGHGDTSAPMTASYSIVEQVEYVKQVAATLGIKQFHLVGNSMGGAISSLYAATYPEQVLSATLISPAGVHDVPSDMDKLLEGGSNPLIATTLEEFDAVMDFVMVEKPFIPAPIAKVEAEKSVARVEINRKIFKDIRQDLELGLESRFQNISSPVLIIWGDQDRAIHVGNIDKYASLIPNAKKAVYEGIGHLAMLEVPERSANELKSFLKSI